MLYNTLKLTSYNCLRKCEYLIIKNASYHFDDVQYINDG